MKKMCVVILAVLLLSGCSPTIREESDTATVSFTSSFAKNESKDTKDETAISKEGTESTTIPD